ncbi:steroid C27-monooxygenase [Nocardia sp. 852002-20019_SCH5090214]|uniref:Cytochrome P450 n=1 Tax=Nocardia nova TaxID=37330 RepID=A0A2S5ZY83_9NOCA|nr:MULTISPECIES: cytochrome P450 [Nocardia]OBA57884.1 steroid C27-monooxygenase [Nocardia sp. 852002-20019_SCH5090214]PPJ23061.1 cytochrome P450 [Nocardia nova]
MRATRPDIPRDFDVTDPDMWARRVPVEELAELRRAAPIWWNAKSPGSDGFPDDGFWVVTKHADVKEVSRRSDVFSNAENTALPRYGVELTPERMEMQRLVLLNQDAPQHTRMRKLISKGFTPRAVNGLRAELSARAEAIVTAAAEAGAGDFVTQVACELPLQAIAELIGVPQEDRMKIFRWSNEMIGYDDPEYAGVDPLAASAELLAYAWQMAEARKSRPADDIVTELVHADVDGEALTSEEFGFFVILLAVAGNETTRNAITHGMIAFLENPDQWELFKSQRPKTTVDEIVRWATPVSTFQRTALEDTELGGVPIRKGQRVLIVYRSANFDEEVFDAPFTFDITRDPNPHLAFGGTGAHFCIGANLARLEIDLIFNAVADHLPDIRKLGDPRRLRSGWLNGIKEFQVRYRGE